MELSGAMPPRVEFIWVFAPKPALPFLIVNFFPLY